MAYAKRILVLGASAGGGHMSNAQSIKAWLDQEETSVEVEVYDVFSSLPHFLGRNPVSLAYYILSVHFPFLWKIFMSRSFISQPKFMDKVALYLGKVLGYAATKKKIITFQPDCIICTYAPIVAPLQKLLTKIDVSAPVKLVITDIFSAPPYWLGGSADEYFTMSENATELVHKFIPNARVQQLPVILHPKYFQLTTKKYHKNKHVVLLAGGEGVNKLNTIAELFSRYSPYTITVICGKDTISYNQLIKQQKKEGWRKTTILGFTNNIEEYLSSADLVISKAGPASMFEVFRYKVPLLCYHYIYGTEEENIHFLIKNNLGVYQKDVRLLLITAEAIINKTITLQTIDVPPLNSNDINYLRALPDTQ